MPCHEVHLHGQQHIFDTHEHHLMMGMLWAARIGAKHNLDFVKITMLRELEKQPTRPGYFTSSAIDAPVWSQYDLPFLIPLGAKFFTPPGDSYASYLWELKIACTPLTAHTVMELESYIACLST